MEMVLIRPKYFKSLITSICKETVFESGRIHDRDQIIPSRINGY